MPRPASVRPDPWIGKRIQYACDRCGMLVWATVDWIENKTVKGRQYKVLVSVCPNCGSRNRMYVHPETKPSGDA